MLLFEQGYSPQWLRCFFKARQFCETQKMECPGENVEPAAFAATARQCTINCAENLKCMSAFYSASKACNLRSARCSMNELKGADGVDLYRLSEFQLVILLVILVIKDVKTVRIITMEIRCHFRRRAVIPTPNTYLLKPLLVPVKTVDYYVVLLRYLTDYCSAFLQRWESLARAAVSHSVSVHSSPATEYQ